MIISIPFIYNFKTLNFFYFLFKRLENSHYQTLIFNLLILCVKEWRVNSIDELEPDTNRFVVQESEVINNGKFFLWFRFILILYLCKFI